MLAPFFDKQIGPERWDIKTGMEFWLREAAEELGFKERKGI